MPYREFVLWLVAPVAQKAYMNANERWSVTKVNGRLYK